jgi:energy-coupling factor transporter ATP-binding protein EcfA2
MADKINLDTGTDLPETFFLTEEFKNLFHKIENDNSNLFITGKAGCGKSTLLEYFRQNTKKNHAILAYTGLAAIKARGMTIHSFFKFPSRFIQKKDKEIKLLKDPELLKRLDTLLIDECSMVRADLFDAVDESLRKNRKNKKPFGGVQIILFGDLLQIAPIVTRSDKEIIDQIYPRGSFFFNSNVFKKANFETHELTKIFRQSDESFINLLNKFRVAKVDEKDLDQINKRYLGDDFEPEEGVIILSTKNDKVDYINQAKLDKIKTKSFIYKAEIKGKFKLELPVKENLELKVGAQVMITKNDIEPVRRWVNGTVGFIHSLTPDEIKIRIKDKIYNLGKSKWENFEYARNGNLIVPKVVGTFIQYPLKLAWAATIHKCQGQTFEKVAIDLDTGSFAHGQTYVALSRATSLEGIYLMREINSGDLIFDKKVFNFLGTKLEKKYVDEIKNFKEKKITYKKAKETDVKVISSDWTHEEEQKLINFYKKNVPEIVLSKIFKRSMNEIREKILKLLKLN